MRPLQFGKLRLLGSYQRYASFADDHGIWHIGINASKGEHVYEGFHIQNVNAYITRLKEWLRPFKGVESHYLPSYLAGAA